MALSKTPWVNIFHQDDVMLPGHLASVIKELEGIERGATPFGLLAGPVKVIDEQSRLVPASVIDPGGRLGSSVMPGTLEYLGFPPGEFAGFLVRENPLRCSAVVTNRAAHAALGGFDPSYRYVVDWEFWYRVAREYAVSWKVQQPTILVRWHAASETHRFKTGMDDLEETARLLDHIFSQGDPGKTESTRDRRVANRATKPRLPQPVARVPAQRPGRPGPVLPDARVESFPTRVIRTLATDPRLCAQMTTLAARPSLAQRWFARSR